MVVKRKRKSEGWFPERTALVMIGILSGALAIFTAIQIYPVDGIWMAILWGVGSAAGLWIVFLGSLMLNRLLRGRPHSH